MIQTRVTCDRCRMVHLVSHHPDLRDAQEALLKSGWILQSFLDPAAPDLCPDCLKEIEYSQYRDRATVV